MKMIKVSDLKEFASTFFADPVLQLAGIAIAENAPSVDAVEVVHGAWVGVEFDTAFICSKCGHVVSYELSKYCPNCGAKMDGDGNDN